MSDSLNRRAFLQSTAALAAAAAISPAFADQPPPAAIPYPENGTLIPDDGWRLWLDREAKWAEDDIHLPEEIQMSSQGLLQANGKPLPVNAPTGGWSTLTPTTGKEVLLPTSVEQHFWATGSGPNAAGEPGTPRPYLPTEYRYAAPPETWKTEGAGGFIPLNTTSSKAGASAPVATTAPPPADDTVPINGAYFGVSWWHRPITIPTEMRGKRIFLHIRGAHLRAEVYLNRQLVGYSIMEELPFECDLTHAANPGGDNHLAIRITNPFGRYDWVDGLNAKWGKLSLYRSHGFGALDRGITISAHDGARICDAWVLNTDNFQTVVVYVKAEPDSVDPINLLEFAVFETDGRKTAAPKVGGGAGFISSLLCSDTGTSGKCVSIPDRPGSFPSPFELKLTWPEAELWDLQRPKLYHLRVTAQTSSGKIDTRTIAFGFRTFAPSGLGTNALFRLNGRRIKLYSSISWGFWGLNGMFPVPELAEKEVIQAKKLNLNCLNFHRNLAKEDVLRAQDRLGLLRYMEPGAGKLAIGKLPSGVQANSAGIVMEKPTSEADKFAQRYMFTKCVEMVKAHRSHPSVIVYCLQNEIGADLSNPATLAVLAAMRAEDPSRCIVLNDGFVAPPRKAAQAWYEPWNPKLHRSDEEPWGGWWNQHQGAGDQWYDEFYKSPTDFTYYSPERKVLSEFGEMEGCATPDNHALMLHQQATAPLLKYGGLSYDQRDHQEIDTATSAWLSKWNFRKAFPTTEHLYNALGKKCYDTWQNYLENARISDDLDFAVISGWESTSIENHSGIVDNLRNFKSDPARIAQTLQPIHCVAKQHTTVIEFDPQGDKNATFDLYLLNDSGTPATGTLTFSMTSPHGTSTVLKSFPAPPQTADVFSYLLEAGYTTPRLAEEGLYRFYFSLSSVPSATQVKEMFVSCIVETDFVNTGYFADKAQSIGVWLNCGNSYGRIAVSGVSAAFRKQIAEVARYTCHTIDDFRPGEKYAAIITSGTTSHATGAGASAGETTGLESAPPPTAVNGRKLEPGEPPVTNQLGHIDPAVLDAVRAGTPLLAIPQANTLSDGVAKQLAEAGAFTFHGNVGDFRAPWMGNWYFVREHPLYAGMPVNQAMGMFYQCKGRASNGLIIDQPAAADQARNVAPVEIVVGYSRDHDRKLGAGTFTTSLGKGKIVYHRCPDFHPVLQQRFLANCLRWLGT